MYKSTFLFITLATLFLLACNKDMSPIEPDKPESLRPLTKEERYISTAARDFGFDLFKAISVSSGNEDIFISPLSVSMALGMTLNGADSSTYSAMRNTLGFEGLSENQINDAYKSLISLLTQADPKVIFEIANSIWYRDQFVVNPIFLETNRTFFDATILPKNFNDPSTVDDINNWVNEKTHGKISEIIDEINPATLMFLINAIYFKGTWQYEFDKEKTKTAPFYLLDGSEKNCEMMQAEGDFNYFEDQEIQMVDLPYGKGNFSMTVILPRKSSEIGTLIENLNINQWLNYLDNMDTSTVMLKLPKFKLEYKITLNKILTELGMGIAFSPGQADFSRIVNDISLFISRVLHKTFVQVDEEGTEAAAVTVVEIRYTSVEPSSTLMQVDRPFIFIIRERQSDTILFMGKILQPEWSE